MNRTLLIVAAHPDDEVLGCAHELLRHPARCRVLHTTDGAPFEERFWAQAGAVSRKAYAQYRRAELMRAMDTLDVAPDRVDCLGIPDREAARQLPTLIEGIVAYLHQWKPSIVYTHPFEGGHPDHDATAFAVQQACGKVEAAGGIVPERREFTSYHAKDGEFHSGEFLSGAGCVQTVELSSEEQGRKRAALDCYRSQQRVIQRFALSPHRWRLAPHYRFTVRPHDGPLYYEIREMGYQFEDFAALVRAATTK